MIKKILSTIIILSGMPLVAFALPPCVTSVISNFFDCHGTQKNRAGDWYEGDFHNGNFHGLGKINFSNGEKYQGEFKDNFALRGTMYYLNGDTYEGEWFNNMFDGQGIYRHANGWARIGEWKDGQPHGRQIHYDKNNCIFRSGIFMNGVYSSYEDIEVQKFNRLKFNAQGLCGSK